MNNHVGFLKKEISVVTIATVVIYFVAYAFQVGYARFYGYPLEFIGNDIVVILKTAGFLGVFLLSLYIFIENLILVKKPPFIFLVLCALFITLMLSIFFTGYKSTFGIFRGRWDEKHVVLLAFSASLIFSITQCKSVIASATSTLKLRNVVLSVTALIFSSYFSGWASGFIPDTLYVSKNGYYILNSFGTNLVLGKCENGQADFLIEGFDGGMVFKVVNRKESEQVKGCFMVSRKNSLKIRS